MLYLPYWQLDGDLCWVIPQSHDLFVRIPLGLTERLQLKLHPTPLISDNINIIISTIVTITDIFTIIIQCIYKLYNFYCNMIRNEGKKRGKKKKKMTANRIHFFVILRTIQE